MLQFIAFIIFIFSFFGIAFMLYKKAPLVGMLPKTGSHAFKKHDLVAKVEGKVKDLHFHFFSKQMLAHRVLSFIKIWTLKAETKLDHLLHGIRKNAQEMDKKTKGGKK